MPTISIITATFNAASTLEDCLRSVAYQAMDVEHILIDGGSKDGTLAIAAEHKGRLSRIISEQDRGIYDAMNKGIKIADGEVIGILNADDWYADEKVLSKVVRVFDNQNVDGCYSDLIYVSNGHKNGLERQRYKILRYWKTGKFSPNKFKWGWMPPHPTLFLRRSVYEKYGLFKLQLGSAADYELMLRFLLKHRIKVVYIPEVLVYMSAGGVSNHSIKNRLKANRMDRKAWQVNGLTPYPWTLIMKPLRKIPQYIQRPLSRAD